MKENEHSVYLEEEEEFTFKYTVISKTVALSCAALFTAHRKLLASECTIGMANNAMAMLGPSEEKKC